MFELTEAVTRRVASPPLAPSDRPIDTDHLARMTLADRALEREVLGLFREQIGVLRGRMGVAEPAVTAAAAHTLKGSATGIGAWALARAAAEVENAGRLNDLRTLHAALMQLDAATQAVTAEIQDLLQQGEVCEELADMGRGTA